MSFWYKQSWLSWLLLPLALIFYFITALRRWAYQTGILKSWRAPCPVVVVGNLSVGGNGKTPLVIWLVEQLQKQGVRVAVISRGYGGKAETYPILVDAHSDSQQVGDEPLLIAKRTGVPVAVGANRQESIQLLQQKYQTQLIISDDGLQHYRLQRDVEIVVIDGQRRFGNGFLLPAGPLRELPRLRLATVDVVVCNGGQPQAGEDKMCLVTEQAINLVTGERRALNSFKQVIAMAGIGYPQRFFNTLQQQGIILQQCYEFADHKAYTESDFQQMDTAFPLLMTEKDAVKCGSFSQKNWWYVPVSAEIVGDRLQQQLKQLVEKLSNE